MSANTYGRQVVLPLTNKSGGGVIAGDVVVVDTTNNDAFTTTTSAASTTIVGIAQETIASNAIGRVLLNGYAALVNVNASVTRGYYGQTHTVAKQAASAGASRQAGTFCQFLTGGTTPDATIWPTDLGGGSGMSNPMTNIGDIIQGTTAGAPQALASPLAGKVLTGAGTTTPLVYAYPPGYEFNYTQITSPVSTSATTEGTATTIVTSGSVTYDGSTIILIHFFAPRVDISSNNPAVSLVFLIYEDSTLLGRIITMSDNSTSVNQLLGSSNAFLRRTPGAGAHTYTMKFYGTQSAGGTVAAGVGGTGTDLATFIRITKV